jgi:hypothetical protein
MAAVAQLSHNIIQKTEEPFSVGLIGGGFSGIVCIINLIRTLLENPRSAQTPIKIEWFDAKTPGGGGIAYANDALKKYERVYKTTEPHQRMGIFPDDPENYSRWLKRHPEEEIDSFGFTSRATYGRFLQSELRNYLHKAEKNKLPLIIEKHSQSLITNIEVFGGQYALYSQSTASAKITDAVVAAIGHVACDVFGQFTKAEPYVRKPFSVLELQGAWRSAVDNRDRSAPLEIVIIGGGPTTLDAIKGFLAFAQEEKLYDQIHFTVISSSPARVWGNNYSNESFARFKSYKYKHLTIKKLLGVIKKSRFSTSERIHAAIGGFFANEIREAQSQGFGPAHVLYGINLKRVYPFFYKMLKSRDQALQQGFRRFFDQLRFLRGAAASPETTELIYALRRSGKIKFILGRAEASKALYCIESKRFKLIVENRSKVYGHILVNGAPIKLSSISEENSFVASLMRNELASFTSAGLLTATKENILIIGPQAADKEDPDLPAFGFGVETFRGPVQESAQQICRLYFDFQNSKAREEL